MEIKDVLNGKSKFSGWLYVKSNNIDLDSDCFFYCTDLNLSPDEEADVRLGFMKEGWRVTLSGEDIEDIIENTHEQIESPSIHDLLIAFNFFLENDAFIAFD